MMSGEDGPLKPLKWYTSLGTRKGRREASCFLVEGERALRQVWQTKPERIVEYVIVEDHTVSYRDRPVRLVTERQFASISQVKTPQGVMAVVRIPEGVESGHLPETPGARVLLLENVQDPGNVGALIRTAAALYFDGVILSEGCADPFAPKSVQASAGSMLSVWIRRHAGYLEMIRSLKASDHALIAADVKGDSDPTSLDVGRAILLALGNEASGLSEVLMEMSDIRVRIPMASDRVESLNVAASGAILMYAVSQI